MSANVSILRVGHTVTALFVSLMMVSAASAASAEDHSSESYSPEDHSPAAYASSRDDGAVATVHPLATKAGMDALAAGGTAIDAAIAAAMTLGVVDSQNSGIGGGNFAVIRWADGSIEALDGREMAPAAAHRDMYVRDGKADGALSSTGALAVGIPGSVAVYDYMQRRGAKKSWAELIEPAAKLAEAGFPLSNMSARRLARSADKLKRFSASRAILLDSKGQPWPEGHILKQPELAASYRALAAQGADYFYRGDFAKKTAGWMAANGGIVTAKDFADYRMKKRQPVISDYRGYRIVGFPPPSSGGVHVAQMLNMLSGYDVAALPELQRYHLLAEVMRLAFADRARYLGDPDFVDVPRSLLSRAYNQQRGGTIDFKKSASHVDYGKPPATEDGGDIDLFGKHTTHISAADKYGNWVAITTTVNTSFGSKVIVPGTGVVLNNQMDDFSIQPGVPNSFGLVGSEANSVAAGKRPLSSMSPTLVFKGEQPLMTLGAAGGPTIITQVLQALVNVIDLDMSVQQALAAQRVHHQWRPQLLFIEQNMSQSLRDQLTGLGHKVFPRGHFGATQMIRQNADGGFEAASEPRVVGRNAGVIK